MRNRIALTGKLRSGKSAVASIMEKHYGYRTVSFGAKLKRYADDIFEHLSEDITKEDELFGGEIVVAKRKPRALYQQFGQKMREIDPSVWIKHAESSMSVWEGLRSVNGVVIDDLRQPNEYDWARDNGFTIIRVNAREDFRIQRAINSGDKFDLDSLKHDTEQHVDSFSVDYGINNDGDMEALRRKVDEIMGEIIAKGGR